MDPLSFITPWTTKRIIICILSKFTLFFAANGVYSSHLGLAFFLMLRPFFPELVISTDLLSFRTSLGTSIFLSRSLYLNFNYLVSVTAGAPVNPRGHMKPSPTVDFGWFVENITFSVFKIDWNCNCVGFFSTSLLASAYFDTFLSLLFNFLNYMFGSGSLMRVQYPKCAYGHYR